MTGPIETPEQAWQAGSAVVGGAGTEVRQRFITASLTTSGVALGGFDVQISRWLARFDEETIAVILGWVERAYTAGKQAAAGSHLGDDSARLRSVLGRLLELTDIDKDDDPDLVYVVEGIEKAAKEGLS